MWTKKFNIKMENNNFMKAKCFGKNIYGRCGALYTTDCNYDTCPFYKSVEKAKEDSRKAEKRCKSLGIPSGNDYTIWKKSKDLDEKNK